LRADLSIIQRSPHSIPIKYVPLGQDAAVAYGVLDLKFRNDFDFPVYIDSKIIGDRVHIYIYGDKNAKNYNVSLDSEIIETIPPKEEIIVDKNLAHGTKKVVQQGRTGYKVNTYKSIIKNGKVVNKTLITKDFYKPKNHVFLVSEDYDKSIEN
jgi:vancomycin resistance protein YoaR